MGGMQQSQTKPGKNRQNKKFGETYELEIHNGLKQIVERELRSSEDIELVIHHSKRPDAVILSIAEPDTLKKLRTPIAAYRLISFKVPSPSAILQGRQFEELVTTIKIIRKRESFTSFRISAAGSDSPLFKNFIIKLSKETGLKHLKEEGEMVIRFRRSELYSFGWDVLLRLTPRPLSARGWRTSNIPGALNGCLAAAICILAEPSKNDSVLNPMVGSGTLLVERHLYGSYKRLVGFDLSKEMLAASSAHLANVGASAQLIRQTIEGDLSGLGKFDSILCDLPYGKLIGSEVDLEKLYALFLENCWTVGSATCRLIAITQEVALFDKVLKAKKQLWTLTNRLRVRQADYLPGIYVCDRVCA